MAEQFDSIYFRGQGPAMIAPRDTDGSPMGFEFVGDVESIEGTPNVSKQPIKENVSGKRLTAESFVTDLSYPITINFKSVKPSHLARALQATLTIKAAGSVTDEAHTAYLDKITKLDHVKVSSVVITGSGGTPTYVEGTDYVVHADEGAVEFISGGTITNATPVVIDYSYAAQKHLVANPQNDKFVLAFMGMNTVNSNKVGRCTIYKIVIDPAFLGLIQQDSEAALSVNAEMLVDTLRAEDDQLYGWEFED